MSDSPVSQMLVDVHVGGVSREDPLSSDAEEGEETSIRLNRHNTRAAFKWSLPWLDSPLVESADASSSVRRLLKRRNVYFLLGEATMVFDIDGFYSKEHPMCSLMGFVHKNILCAHANPNAWI